jgi:hypothetical protein
VRTGCYQIDNGHEVRLPACCATCRSRRITSYGFEGCGCGPDGPDGKMLPDEQVEEMPPNWVCPWYRKADQ